MKIVQLSTDHIDGILWLIIIIIDWLMPSEVLLKEQFHKHFVKNTFEAAPMKPIIYEGLIKKPREKYLKKHI